MRLFLLAFLAWTLVEIDIPMAEAAGIRSRRQCVGGKCQVRQGGCIGGKCKTIIRR